jgi:hypothetical protein
LKSLIDETVMAGAPVRLIPNSCCCDVRELRRKSRCCLGAEPEVHANREAVARHECAAAKEGERAAVAPL